MESKLKKKEQRKVKCFFYTCKLKFLFFSNLLRIIKFILFVGIYANLLCMKFASPLHMIIAIVLYSFAYFIALLIIKLYLFIASSRYDSLEINRISHKIGGSFVEKASSDIISSYKTDFARIRKDYMGKSVKTTTHTIIIINFIKALAPPGRTTRQICLDIINASKNPNTPFSKKYSFSGQYEVTINRAQKGKEKNGVAHNSLRIIKYQNVPYSKMTDRDLKDLYELDTFYDLCITFH